MTFSVLSGKFLVKMVGSWTHWLSSHTCVRCLTLSLCAVLPLCFRPSSAMLSLHTSLFLPLGRVPPSTKPGICSQ